MWRSSRATQLLGELVPLLLALVPVPVEPVVMLVLLLVQLRKLVHLVAVRLLLEAVASVVVLSNSLPVKGHL